MRNSAIFLAAFFLCQSACFADDDIEKSLDKLLGKPAPITDSDAAPTASSDAAAAPAAKPAKPKKEKKQREKKSKADSTAVDVPKVDPAKIEKSLDKLLGTGSTSSSSRTSLSPPMDTSSTPTVPAVDTSTVSQSPPLPPPDSTDQSSAAAMPPSASSSDKDNDTTNGEYNLTDNQIKAGELNNQAITAMNAKQFQKAIDLLKQALTIYPGYTVGKNNLRVAYYNAAVELSNNAKWAEAMPFIEKAYQMMKEMHRDDADIKGLYADCKKATAAK